MERSLKQISNDKLFPLYRFFRRYWPELILLCGSLDRLWITEDAFISFRTVENVVHGCGPVFNCGIRVESYTHPLWLGILVALRLLGGRELLPLLSAMIGIALTLGGFLLIRRAHERFGNRLNRDAVPVGYAMMACLPVFWDFASSGLETGLSFGWIGAITWIVSASASTSGLVFKGEKRDSWSPRALHFFILGLGPVIRPDLAVVSAISLATIIWRHRLFGSPVQLLNLSAAAGALPAGYQLFRMGYFGLLYPNTALAKEGFLTRWDQGWLYLWNLVSTYYLFIAPILALLCLGLARYRSIRNPYCRSLTPLAIAGLCYGLAIVRIGGDFMHGRMLLPAVMLLGASFAWIHIPHDRNLRRWLTAMLGAWCAFIALFATTPDRGNIGTHGIVDERWYYTHIATVGRPIRLSDFRHNFLYRQGLTFRKITESGASAVYYGNIGISGMVAGLKTVVVDPMGLNDYLSSHMRLNVRGRPGHEKFAPAAWFLARYPQGFVTPSSMKDQVGRTSTPRDVMTARRVLEQAEPVAALEKAVTEPMTLSRFITNVRRARELSKLRIPPNPEEAAWQFGIALPP